VGRGGSGDRGARATFGFMQPLSGVTVLDLTRLLPGGFCTLTLADLGARIIKVEEPGRGDYLRAFTPLGRTQSVLFSALNRGKESVTLDLKSTGGREIFLELARRADVVLEGFRPGVLARLKLAPETLLDVNSRLVVCSISGYGQSGPLRDHVGHDLNYLSYAGALPLFTERGGGRPIVPGMQIADLAGGALSSTVGILAALLDRANTGKGCVLDISMTHGVLHLLQVYAGQLLATGSSPVGGRGPLSGGVACYSAYMTRDGKAITVAAVEERFWKNLCDRVGKPEMIALQYEPWETQQQLFAELDALFATRTRDEWMEFFGSTEVCVAPVLSLEESLALHQDRLIDIDQPGEGVMRQLGGMFGSTATAPAPSLGEHTDGVLEWIGKSGDEIAALRQQRII
jgi:crotonobetainyl-CoA:carnitine CoA-transferase CaiB-like acyl-CoA transferase